MALFTVALDKASTTLLNKLGASVDRLITAIENEPHGIASVLGPIFGNSNKQLATLGDDINELDIDVRRHVHATFENTGSLNINEDAIGLLQTTVLELRQVAQKFLDTILQPDQPVLTVTYKGEEIIGMARFIVYAITADAPSKSSVTKRTLTTPAGAKDYPADTTSFDDLKVADTATGTVSLQDFAGDVAGDASSVDFDASTVPNTKPDAPSGLKVEPKGEVFE